MKTNLCLALLMTIAITASASKTNSWPTTNAGKPTTDDLVAKYPSWPKEKFPKSQPAVKFPELKYPQL